MPFILGAIFALAVSLSVILGWKTRSREPIVLARPILGALAVGAVAIIAKLSIPSQNVAAVEMGLFVGSLAALLATFLDRFNASGTVAASVGCAVSGFLFFIGKPGLDLCCLAIVVAAGAFGALQANRTCSLTAVVLAAVGLATLLGSGKSDNPVQTMVAPIGMGASTLTCLVGLATKGSRFNPQFWPILACFFSLLSTALLTKICFIGTSDWFGLLLVPIGVSVVYFLDRSTSERQKFAWALTTVIWIALATVAFGIGRGLGIGAAFVVSTGLLLTLDADRVLLSSGPLLALVLHRSFRLEHSGVGAAIDIGQHYALIGFAIGALLPLLPTEWLNLQGRLRPTLQTIGGVIWLAICFMVPCLIALFLSPKGLLGFVTGLGFCGFFALSDKKVNVGVLGLAACTGSLAIIQYGIVERVTDLTRDEKIHWLLISGVVLAIVAALLGGVGAFKIKEPAPLGPI